MILDGDAPWTLSQMRAQSRHCMSTGQLQVQGPTCQPVSRLSKGGAPVAYKGTMEVSIFNLILYLQHLTSITWIVSLK